MKTKLFLFFLLLVAATQLKANNMLVKNVTTTGDNAANKTIQVQFDMSWDNSWRDAINWDAAWVFMKYKDANGNWQHVQLNTTGFANGTGTANTIQVGSDKVGAFVYRSAPGTGTFANSSMQLQWNYGLSGLTSVTGLEIRVFAVEMVYVPQGEFNCTKIFFDSSEYCLNPRSFFASGNNFPIINNRLGPVFTCNDEVQSSIRIKGDVGIDTNIDGVIDNTSYPTGFKAFYCYKYELTEQQYADFLNTLTSNQKTTLGVAGSNIALNNGQYFSSTPNRACGNATANRILSYSDWSGLRLMSFLEINKASYGPFQPIFYQATNCQGGFCGTYYYKYGYPTSGNGNFVLGLSDVGSLANSTSNRAQSGSSYYGILDLTGNAKEPIVPLSFINYSISNGNGALGASGLTDNSQWSTPIIKHIEFSKNSSSALCEVSSNWSTELGFRYVRSAE
jgi:hypothetical protein